MHLCQADCVWSSIFPDVKWKYMLSVGIYKCNQWVHSLLKACRGHLYLDLLPDLIGHMCNLGLINFEIGSCLLKLAVFELPDNQR